MTAATLRDHWQAHADRVLPIDASQAAVIREKRRWYGAQLDRLAGIQNRSAADEALFREAIQFGRLIGSALESAGVKPKRGAAKVH